jgi:hypothetical protein
MNGSGTVACLSGRARSTSHELDYMTSALNTMVCVYGTGFLPALQSILPRHGFSISHNVCALLFRGYHHRSNGLLTARASTSAARIKQRSLRRVTSDHSKAVSLSNSNAANNVAITQADVEIAEASATLTCGVEHADDEKGEAASSNETENGVCQKCIYVFCSCRACLLLLFSHFCELVRLSWLGGFLPLWIALQWCGILHISVRSTNHGGWFSALVEIDA